jgi:hypothetical protein
MLEEWISPTQLKTAFYKLPDSHVVACYVRSSHQNDPGRTLVEIAVSVFLIVTILQQRTPGASRTHSSPSRRSARSAARRFIVTEDIFENGGAMADLPNIVRSRLVIIFKPAS